MAFNFNLLNILRILFISSFLINGIVNLIIYIINKTRRENIEENNRKKIERQRIVTIVRREEKEIEAQRNEKMDPEEKMIRRRKRVTELFRGIDMESEKDIREMEERREQENKIFDLLKEEARKDKENGINIRIN